MSAFRKLGLGKQQLVALVHSGSLRFERRVKVGRIGEHAGTSYYLLYSQNQNADMALDAEFLKTTAVQDADKKLVVY